MAKRLGVTTRHLRRAFIEGVGVGPKDFARTDRLQRAIRYAETSSDWGRIAADTGYYDQSHLIADFRQLLGLTPNAFLRRVGDRGVRRMSDASLLSMNAPVQSCGGSLQERGCRLDGLSVSRS